MAKNTNNKFVVSVCDAYAVDIETGEGLWAGMSNISTAFNITMTASDIKGGDGNQMIFRYMHDRMVTVTVTAAKFSPSILSMNVGSDLEKVANVATWTTECVNFKDGVGTLVGVNVGKVTVFFEDGSAEAVTPTTKTITLTDTTFNGIANVGYTSMVANVGEIVVDTTKAPKTVKLILVGNIKDASGVVVQKINIEVPRYSVDGNYDLAFASDGVSQDTITGTALAVPGTTCASGNGYAWIRFIDVDNTTTP